MFTFLCMYRFQLLGLGLLIVGIIMKVDSDIIEKEEVSKTLNEVTFNGNLKLGNVASSLSVLIICIGVFVLIVAAFGCFGACCKNRCMLVVVSINSGMIPDRISIEIVDRVT